LERAGVETGTVAALAATDTGFYGAACTVGAAMTAALTGATTSGSPDDLVI